MALSKVSMATALLLLTVFIAAAASPASAACHKVTVQNLSGRDLWLTLEPRANSPLFFGGPGYLLRHGTHAEFPSVCFWTGLLHAPDAPAVDFHVGGPDGGVWYKAPVGQSGPVRVSVTPHGALQGHCPAVGCSNGGRCFAHEVPDGNCHNADELKIIYFSP